MNLAAEEICGLEFRMSLTIISKVRARQVLDSRGNPTVEVDVEQEGKPDRSPVHIYGSLVRSAWALVVGVAETHCRR